MIPSNGKPHPIPTESLVPRGRALLVDENEEDLKHFTTLLGRMGYSVRAFVHSLEAQGCLENEHFDFVMVSQGSPAFETYHLVEFALARDRYTPVVVVTRCLHMNSYLQAMHLGASDYLEKPMSTQEFERVVTTHCKPRQDEISSGQA
jgi:DNA-binding NtrC family response regulator